jgi:hypothetical protein
LQSIAKAASATVVYDAGVYLFLNSRTAYTPPQPQSEPITIQVLDLSQTDYEMALQLIRAVAGPLEIEGFPELKAAVISGPYSQVNTVCSAVEGFLRSRPGQAGQAAPQQQVLRVVPLSYADPYDNLALAGTVGDSKLSWSANVPAGTTLTVQTSVDDGVTWQTATNGGPIPGLSPNLDVSEKSLLVRQILTTQSPTTTPKLYWLEISVTPGISPNDPTPGWEMVWYEYDALNRPVRVYTNRLATELWDVTQYEYGLPLDLPTRLDLPGPTEVVHAYWYNTRGLKVEEDSGLPEQISWTYDATGRVDRV